MLLRLVFAVVSIECPTSAIDVRQGETLGLDECSLLQVQGLHVLGREVPALIEDEASSKAPAGLEQLCKKPRGQGLCADLPRRPLQEVSGQLEPATSFADFGSSHAYGTESWAAVPAAGSGLPMHKIMFGSCNQQNADQSFWNGLAAEEPNLMILGGDNVYAGCRSVACPEMATAYETLANVDEFQDFARAVPLLAIWDDWDYGENDGDNTWQGKELSKRHFMNFFDALEGQARHTPGRGQQGRGIEASYMIGPEGQDVQVILLDTRWYRDAFREVAEDLKNQPGTEFYAHDADVPGTMLGEEQWQWLEEELTRPARLRVVVSGIQLMSESHGWECWACMPSERSRMLGLLHAASPVVFVSGDRHMGGLYQLADSPHVVEVTASSFTHTMPQEMATKFQQQDPRLAAPLLFDNNVGLIDIDWDRAVAQVSLMSIGHSGPARGVIELPL